MCLPRSALLKGGADGDADGVARDGRACDAVNLAALGGLNLRGIGAEANAATELGFRAGLVVFVRLPTVDCRTGDGASGI